MKISWNTIDNTKTPNHTGMTGWVVTKRDLKMGNQGEGGGAKINVREGPRGCGWGHSSKVYHLSGRNKGWGAG